MKQINESTWQCSYEEKEAIDKALREGKEVRLGGRVVTEDNCIATQVSVLTWHISFLHIAGKIAY